MSVLVAAALDVGRGEPGERWHPVVWAGGYLAAAERVVPAAPRGRAAVAGGLAWLAGSVVAVVSAGVVERAATRLHGPLSPVVRGLALWPLLSVRVLLAEVAAVESALHRGTPAGRTAVSRIVSRDTAGLADEEIRGAAVESLAENLSDSVVAPLFWYLLAGLPGAALYRFANTADACWGYRSARWQHAGACAAVAEDVLNLVPARLTAALLLAPGSPGDWAAVRAEAGKTDSPNAGWPMAAMALRLGIRLGKPGHYDLNPAAAQPGPGAVRAALRTARCTAAVAVALAVATELITRRPRGES